MSKENRLIHESLTYFFQTRHFQQIQTDSPQVSMFATFYDASLYLINLITLDAGYGYDKEMYVRYKERTRKQFQSIEADCIYLLNVLIVDDPVKIYNDIDEKPDLEDRFIDIHWLIDSDNRELIIPPSQPNHVLGLENQLAESVKNGFKQFNDWRKTSNHVYVTRFFMALNLVVFLLSVILMSDTLDLPERFQRFYNFVLLRQQEGTLLWYLVSIVVHGSVWHFLFTTISMYILGSHLEKYLTVFQYISIYCFTALAGAVACYLSQFMTGQVLMSVGSNGAIYGMIASVLILSKAASRPLEGLNDMMIWTIFIVGIIYSILSHDVAAFANIGGFAAGLMISIPIDIIKTRKLLKEEQS